MRAAEGQEDEYPMMVIYFKSCAWLAEWQQADRD